MNKKYVVKTDFTDKHTKRRHLAGDEYTHTDAKRLADLEDKGIIEAADETKTAKKSAHAKNKS